MASLTLILYAASPRIVWLRRLGGGQRGDPISSRNPFLGISDCNRSCRLRQERDKENRGAPETC